MAQAVEIVDELQRMRETAEERGLVTADEIEAGKPLHPAKPVARTLSSDGVAAMLHRGGPTQREVRSPALFAVGDRVRTKVMHPPTHTRLPRYVRGHVGVVELPGQSWTVEAKD